MSDSRLRDLQRRSLDDPSARVALLTERVRTGDLTLERLELAAYVGDVSARTLVPCGPLLLSIWPEGHPQRAEADEWAGALYVQIAADPLARMPLSLWVQGISRWGPETLVRAAVAAAGAAREAGAARDLTCCCGSSIGAHGWGDGHAFTHACDYHHLPDCECPEHPEPVRAIEAANAWLACPCNEHQSAAQDAASTGELRIPPESAWWRQFSNLMLLGQCLQADQCIAALAASASRLAGESLVRSAIQESLVAWALGPAVSKESP